MFFVLSTFRDLREFFMQHYDIFVLGMHTSKDADPLIETDSPCLHGNVAPDSASFLLQVEEFVLPLQQPAVFQKTHSDPTAARGEEGPS